VKGPLEQAAQAGEEAGKPAPRLRRLLLLQALCVAAALAAGCGGGGDAGPAAPPPPPPPPVAPPAAPTPANLPAGYTMVWSDLFESDGLPDPSKWAYDTDRNPFGWWNNELQYYSAGRALNSVVTGGRLHITARRESPSFAADTGGRAYRYTSARLITRGKAAWTYGFFEIRAKMPCGRGTWPAIWMLGTGGVWPDDGEIDILEHVGSDPTRVFGTVHTRAGSGGAGKGAATQLADACTRFHDYQMLWTADAIRIGVNGSFYFRYDNPRSGRAAWPFDAPQYLLLNIAIGGVLGGAVDDGIFPVTMEVEHVKVWQLQ
jgi:beta-glucanase (GH16 family)